MPTEKKRVIFPTNWSSNPSPWLQIKTSLAIGICNMLARFGVVCCPSLSHAPYPQRLWADGYGVICLRLEFPERWWTKEPFSTIFDVSVVSKPPITIHSQGEAGVYNGHLGNTTDQANNEWNQSVKCADYNDKDLEDESSSEEHPEPKAESDDAPDNSVFLVQMTCWIGYGDSTMFIRAPLQDFVVSNPLCSFSLLFYAMFKSSLWQKSFHFLS